MQQLTVNDAVEQALAEEMRRDPRVLMFGEGVATKRQALLKEFGADRVRNTPLAEGVIAGTAAGAAAMGPIVNSAGKLRYLSGGQFSFPMVVLTMTGAGWCVGAQHNHNLEAMFVHAPGLKVLMPSSAADFKGLLKTAIRDDNPVMFFMDLALGHVPGAVPAGEHLVPLGKAALVRGGSDVTLVSYGKTVGQCVQAADLLQAQGVSAEVLDLRSLKPIDHATVLASVRKTGHLVVVHEAGPMCGVGAEVAAVAAEFAFDALRAPVRRVTGPDAPAAASWVLEQAAVPQPDAIAAAAVRSLQAQRVSA
jgi:pyruvate/2-oxoglutarate/acetoin dehydrogenase E1 component